MAVTAAAGIIGFAPQNGKTTDTGYDEPVITGGTPDYYRMKASQVDLAVLDDTRLGDDEIGGRPVPTFPYKAGIMVGGGVTVQPRLESTLGWLLYGMLGDVETAGVAGQTGAYDHTFKFVAADPGAVKWMSFAKYIPRKDNAVASDLGEIYRDCKIVGSSFTFASDRPVQSRLDILGRTFELANDCGLGEANAWTWKNTYEDYETIPIGAHTGGSIQVAGQTLPIVQATVSFQNQPLDTRQERVYGSPYLEDITIVKRQLTVDLLVKWNNPQLYQQILTGTTTGTEWSTQPFSGAFNLVTKTFELIGATTVEHSLTINCPSAMLAMNGGITLAAGQAVLMRFNGVALDNAGEYVTFVLRNGTASYTWPVLTP